MECVSSRYVLVRVSDRKEKPTDNAHDNVPGREEQVEKALGRVYDDCLATREYARVDPSREDRRDGRDEARQIGDASAVEHPVERGRTSHVDRGVEGSLGTLTRT